MISSGTLKDLIPDVKLGEEKDALVAEEEDDTLEVNMKEEDVPTEKPEPAKPRVEEGEKDSEEKPKVAPAETGAVIVQAEEDEAEGDDDGGCEYVKVTNLVRPFTVNQLKDVLSRTGQIAEDGFAINKIKSVCIVKYSKAIQAKQTVTALDGVKWPSGNNKNLKVEFSSEEALKRLRDEGEDRVRAPVRKSQDDEASEAKKRRRDEPKERPKGREREEVRETKPLEVLFRRTKATPNIYWQLNSASLQD